MAQRELQLRAERPANSPARDRAWGRYYARLGFDGITKRYFTPLSNDVRVALYFTRSRRSLQ